jgi:Flp pilus assembly protein TadD
LAGAAVCYEQTLAADPDQWDALYLYGTALLQLGRLHKAIAVFRRAARLRPEIADVQNNLGVACQALGQSDAALRAYKSAIDLSPNFSLAHANLGRLLESSGQLAEAELSWRQAIRFQPQVVSYRLELTRLLGSQDKWAEAERVAGAGLDVAPQNVELQMSLAATLVNQERLDAAADVYRNVLCVQPDLAEAHSSLAFVLERQGHLRDALIAAERATTLRPDYAAGFNNLGIVLRSLHRLDDACVAFRRAIALNAAFALAEFNLGTTLLLAGRYPEGWPGYGRHARVAGTVPPGPATTEWDGRPIPGQRLLVYADQGLGDTIQFARFLPHCKARSEARILFRFQSPLTRLFAELGADELFSNDSALPAFDQHVALASLPGLFGLTIEQAATGVPYLSTHCPPPARIEALLANRSAERHIGFVWQGNPRQTRDVVRSCPLEKLSLLFQLPGYRFFSLQTDQVGRSQLGNAGAAGQLTDVGSLLEDFADTAAVLERLDLLVTVDTAIAHLAGALGRPVWTMLCHTPDWRWHLDRSDSPWYPSMRLFRQPAWGVWDLVVQQIRSALAEF